MRFASKIPQPLLAVVESGARRDVAIAEIWREVGDEAARRGLGRPSYERVRVLVHDARARAAREVTVADLARVATAYDPIGEFLDLATRSGARYPAA